MCTSMTRKMSGGCIIQTLLGRIPTGTNQIYRHDISLTYFGVVLKGIRCVSCLLLHPTASHQSHDTFCPIDNKLSQVSQGSPLTSSRGREGISIPSVCPGFFPFSGLFSSGFCRLRILCRSPVALKWVYRLADGRQSDDEGGWGCSRT